jgi:hypothetical protein
MCQISSSLTLIPLMSYCNHCSSELPILTLSVLYIYIYIYMLARIGHTVKKRD